MKTFLFALVAVALSALPAAAFTLTPVGAVMSAQYTEPTTNTDSSALDDLAATNVHWRLCPTSGVCSAAFTVEANVPASAPTGGGVKTTTFTVPVAVGQQANVEAYVTAVDLSGNTSPDSTHVTKRVDRLSPSAPQ